MTTTAEVPVLLGNGVGADTLQRIPRRVRRDAIRVLMDLGYVLTGNQALAFLHEWQEWRRLDAAVFIAEEFRVYAQQRRGDLVQCRPKPRACDPRRDGHRQL